MNNILQIKKTFIVLMGGLVFLVLPAIAVQARDIGRLEVDAVAVMDSQEPEFTESDNGTIEQISKDSITVSGRDFLLSADTRYYNWQEEENEQNQFAVGNLVSFIFNPATLQILELRMDEEHPETGNKRDRAQQKGSGSSGGDTVRLEKGVYVN